MQRILGGPITATSTPTISGLGAIPTFTTGADWWSPSTWGIAEYLITGLVLVGLYKITK